MPNNNTKLSTLVAGTENEMYTSFSSEGIEGKMALYNAINSPDYRIGDYINTNIVMVDAVLTRVTLKNNDSFDAPGPFADEVPSQAEERKGVRSIIIDKDGHSYTATSEGIYNALKTMYNVFGTLHFPDGLNVMVKQIKTKNGNTLTLQLAK